LSFIDSLRKTVIETQVTVLKVGQEDPPSEIAQSLQLTRTEKATHAVRLRSIGNTPAMVTDAWVPLDLGKHVTATALRKNALYEILQGTEH